MSEGVAISHHGSLMEDRRDENHVRCVGDATLGDIGVVVPVNVPLIDRLFRIVLPHATHDVAAHGVTVYLMTPGV